MQIFFNILFTEFNNYYLYKQKIVILMKWQSATKVTWIDEYAGFYCITLQNTSSKKGKKPAWSIIRKLITCH